jgi:phosphate transport system permease protein
MKKRIEQLFFGLCFICTWMVLIGLVCLVVVLFWQGSSILSVAFLTRSWQHQHPELGGVFPAIVGSLIIGIGVILLSSPLGVITALYLTEYPGQERLRRIITIAIRNLAGIPSIVYGLFGLAVFVQFLSFGTSLLAAICTLSCMSLPWIITSSVEAMESIPSGLRSSSYALGATRIQTIWNIVLPQALPASLTGVILSLARAMGETAPLIMVGATFYLSKLPTSLYDKFMALPYHTFILATQYANPRAMEYASATAFVLISLTSILSLIAISIRFIATRKAL